MMGAGKSSVGPALARRVGTRFVDSDEEIVREAGRSVAEIFASEGEAGFRRRERAVLERLAGEPAVVALGGGAVAQAGAPELLAAAGPIVYLRARPETLLLRMGDCRSRPLLAEVPPAARLDRVRALLAEREPAYAVASLVVDTDEASTEQLAQRIASRLEANGDAP